VSFTVVVYDVNTYILIMSHNGMASVKCADIIMNGEQTTVKMSTNEYVLTEKAKLKVKYENHYIKYKVQVLRRKSVLISESNNIFKLHCRKN
jgi:CRISPR/Cas system-associated protein Cas5 (RAMP superfamily)